MSEADPEGCAACSARLYPPNAYRNGPLYPSYTAAAMKGLFELADRDHMNLLAMLTWAFEFEGKPYFDGYRTLATNGVDKPVLNFFRMAGLMRGDRVAAISSGAAPLDSILKNSVRQAPDIDALATSAPGQASVLLWNYHDDDVAAPGAAIVVSMKSIPPPRLACCCSITASTIITAMPTRCGRRWDRRRTLRPSNTQSCKLPANCNCSTLRGGSLPRMERYKWMCNCPAWVFRFCG